MEDKIITLAEFEAECRVKDAAYQRVKRWSAQLASARSLLIGVASGDLVYCTEEAGMFRAMTFCGMIYAKPA